MPKNYELDPPPPPTTKQIIWPQKKSIMAKKIDLKIQGKYG